MSEYYNTPSSQGQYAYPVFDPHVSGANSMPAPANQSSAAQPNLSNPAPIPSSSPVNPSYPASVPPNPSVPQHVYPVIPDPPEMSYVPPVPSYYQSTPPVMVPNAAPVTAPASMPSPSAPYDPAMQGSPVAPAMGQNILNNPDAEYFQHSPMEVSAYPTIQQPKGSPIIINLDTNNEDVKTQNALLGVGIGAVAAIASGGLLLPVIAGVVGYNLIKKERQSKFSVYPNTYVWELRSAIAELLKVNPELVLMKRKDMIMDDNEMIKKYVKGSKSKATVKISIQNTPVAGSNYYSPNGAVYPRAQCVSLVKK